MRTRIKNARDVRVAIVARGIAYIMRTGNFRRNHGDPGGGSTGTEEQ